MISRQCREAFKRERREAMKRYEKHRRKNLTAEPGRHQFALVLDNLKAGFNVPKIFRSADAFGAAEVHLINIGQFDPAPAKGGFKHVPAKWHDNFAHCYRNLSDKGYRFFTLEPQADSTLFDIALPERCAFVLGHEEMGISFDLNDYPNINAISIPQFGKVQSLNVAVAASLVMYEYVRQHREE